MESTKYSTPRPEEAWRSLSAKSAPRMNNLKFVCPVAHEGTNCKTTMSHAKNTSKI